MALIFIIAGCSFEKKTGFNRAMQNLTAHYNILYNANELLRQKQETYANSYFDAYDNLLSVYQDTIAENEGADKELDAVIIKAHTIINEKEQSKYIADAYLLLGKANFLAGRFFDAVEFFNYVIRSAPDQTDLTQEASVWKVRALLYLNNTREAKLALDSAFQNINPKKSITTHVYATALQYDIDTKKYADAEEMAKKAILYSKDKNQKLRWTFILGQLQELNKHNIDAILSYNSIVNSNASFEMAFNANLNRIRIEEMHNGVKRDRVNLLLSLLKNENNIDFKDQIYYQVADLYYADKDINTAVKYYNLSVRNSSINLNQKGLSYLRLADIDFKDKADYVSAKKYYDSTLNNLSFNYPNYPIIQKKAENLQLLVDKLQIIAREDTLQMLAKLDEKTRLARIDVLVNAHTLQQQIITTNNNNNIAASNAAFANAQGTPTGNPATGTSFYFYNTAAVSQGYSEFKRKWGDRKLDDNWRRSSRQGSSIANNLNTSQSMPGISDPDAPLMASTRKATDVSAGNYRQDLLQNLPLSPALLNQSNTRRYNAYSDIGSFYRDILEDKKEAINTYELLLTKFPDNTDKASIYYNLYRLYSDIDIAKSEQYKNLILKNYPETVFAKVIIDPDYSKKLDDNDARFNASYDMVYDLYRQKKYDQVIVTTDSLVKQYPGNKMLVQLYYLRTIAGGHLEKITPFRTDLEQMVTTYPDDRLITPLVKQHLTYVDANAAELATQDFAIMGNDTTGAFFSPPVAYQKETPYNRNRTFTAVADARAVAKPAQQPPAAVQKPVVTKPVQQLPAEKPPIAKPTEQVAAEKPPVTKPAEQVIAKENPPVTKPAEQVITEEKTPVTQPAEQVTAQAPVVTQPVEQAVVKEKPPVKVVSTLFSMRDSTNYYFVVNVNTGTTDLSSSRFGIGQFIRTNLKPNTVKHELKNAGPDNQLIYVGRFYSLEAVKEFGRAIVPLLPEIMKVPKDKYSFFIITQENLNKLADKNTLDNYIDYYQQTY